MKKALYIRTAKTGSSSIVNWCKSFGHDIPYTEVRKHLNDPDNQNKIQKHFRDESFLFYSIRNPYERALSCWRQALQSCWIGERMSFEQFLELDFHQTMPHTHALTHVIPMTEYLADVLDKVNYVVRLENFEQCMKHVSEELETPYHYPGHHYKGNYTRVNKDQALNAANKKKIEEKYKSDFEFFGY